MLCYGDRVDDVGCGVDVGVGDALLLPSSSSEAEAVTSPDCTAVSNYGEASSFILAQR